MTKPTESQAGGCHLEHLATAPLPTRFGTFELHVYRWDDPKADPSLSDEHLALVMGDVRGERAVAVRVHSECLTSEVFASLKCDCKGQLERAQAEVARRGRGVILYLRQEGRGIGLANKIRAYALQAEGADTIEANQRLHLPVDARQYDVAAAILRELGVESVVLMTNNPAKVDALSALGISVTERLPMLVAANPFSQSYLEVKKKKMRHELPSGVFNQKPPEPEHPDDTESPDPAAAH
ncbi:MAG: GTP cyclohydrolase II [Polyangiaceae bacterium]|nr:GTP cyclohydrolase II [Polyangiaceae bacterium]MCE7892741.1 GTP cyclohydrolase II [Sorangiineae bacterium PRO1]MCL4750657.1 GTP cyclohydrolase II [Myxococcales bacterium]